MAVSRVTREELVEQSVTDFLRYQIFTVREYPADRVELREAFIEDEFAGPLDKNYLQVDPVRTQRQPVPNPKAWQEYLWIVSIPVVDSYYAREV
jgi:hypothetical protein